MHPAGEDIGAQIRLLGERAAEADAVDGGQGVHHRAHGLEPACDEGLGLGQRGGDGLGEVKEKRFALARAVAPVGEAELLERAAAELNEVKVAGFEVGAEGAAVGGVEAALLELDAVEFDAEDEGGGNAVADCASDVKNNAGTVLEATAVFIYALVGRRGEELGEEVATKKLAVTRIGLERWIEG